MFWIRERRRKRLREQPFPEEWHRVADRNVLYYQFLSSDQQEKLQGIVQVFLDEKRFEGCGGLQLTDEIRVTIALQACILLLGDISDFYPKLRTILVYPSSYVAPSKYHRPDGTVSEGLQAREGESWSFGNVVLSWEDVLRGAGRHDDGRNVVFHEFAHQLDSESGEAQGAPILPKRSMYARWARVLGSEYRKLIVCVQQGKPTLIDKYGATNPAEFFAVVTELFFEKPAELHARHPALYRQLMLFFRQDPASWMRD
jgi:Mlc titration factor MtfA (ptsG expression regulator)